MAKKAKSTRQPKARTAYELLQRVCAVIEARPKAYFQDWWMRPAKRETPLRPDHTCGTTYCRAGFIVALHDGPRKVRANDTTATRVLEILGFERGTPEGHAVWRDLFPVGLVEGVPGTPEYAKRGAARIRVFMRQHARHLKARSLKGV